MRIATDDAGRIVSGDFGLQSGCEVARALNDFLCWSIIGHILLLIWYHIEAAEKAFRAILRGRWTKHIASPQL